MSGNLEARIFRLEQQALLMASEIASLQSALAQVQNQQWATGAGVMPSSGGGGNPCFVMAPASGTIDGTWSGSAPSSAGSFTGTVYSFSGGTFTSLGSQTVYNGLPAALVNSKACICLPDEAGNYVVVSQSCS